MPDLLADEQRRTDQGPVRRVLDNPHQYPDQQKRIAALIRDLEVVSDRPSSWPEGSLLDDPVARALIHEGDPAVDRLIDCVAGDDRLSRSVWSGHDPRRWRHLVGTASPAFAILERILDTDHFGTDRIVEIAGRPDPTVAGKIRAYYARNKGKSSVEQWYETLADDSAGPDRWVEAAGRIAEPPDVEHGGGWVMSTYREPGTPALVKGEPLRSKRSPSVAQLLAERVPAIADQNGGMWSAQSHGVDVAIDLYWWDATAAVPVLRDELRRCLDAKWPPGTEMVDDTARDIGRLTTALAAAQDGEGVRRYAAWVVRQGPATAGHNVGSLLQPIWRNPDDADLSAAADTLFNGPASPWWQLSAVPLLTDSDKPSLYASPMYGLPAFRRRVRRDLEDVTVIGSARVTDQELTVTLDQEHGNVAQFGGVNTADPLLPLARDGKVPVRTCDWCASKVSQLDGAPPFELYWPPAKRDEQRAKLAAFLDRWGDRFRYSPPQAAAGGFWYGDADAARMTFPRRDRPAMADDVRQATAIFSLAGGPVRAVPLPAWPAKAKWVTLKDFPVQYQSAEPKTGAVVSVDASLNTGLVWQAEEVQIGGRWMRYYGFVGPHTVARVPAEQIEFVMDR